VADAVAAGGRAGDHGEAPSRSSCDADVGYNASSPGPVIETRSGQSASSHRENTGGPGREDAAHSSGRMQELDRRSMMMLLGGRHWAMPVAEDPVIDTVEIWELINTTEDSRSDHLHPATQLRRTSFLPDAADSPHRVRGEP